MEVGHVIEHSSQPAPNYRELWLSVIRLAVDDACNFDDLSRQTAALQWLFGDSRYECDCRKFVFGLIWVDIDTVARTLAKRVMDRAWAYAEADPHADDAAIRWYMMEQGVNRTTSAMKRPVEFSERVTLANRKSNAARFLSGSWGKRLRRIAGR